MYEQVTKIILEYIDKKNIKTISFVGAGGKTSTIFALKEIWKREFKYDKMALITTTTAMYEPSRTEIDYLIFSENKTSGDLINQLKSISFCKSNNSKTVGIFNNIMEIDGHIKVKGISPELVDSLKASEIFDLIMIEADGANRKSMKAYEIHEPVISKETELVVVVMGLSTLSTAINSNTFHRMPNFLKLVEKSEGDIFESKDIAKLFTGDMGFLRGIPKNADIIVFLNQWDSVPSNYLGDIDNVSKTIINLDERIKSVIVGSIKSDECSIAIMKT